MNNELRWAVLRSADDAAAGLLRCKGYDIDPGIGPHGGFIVDMVERTDPKGREVLGEPRIIEDLGKRWDPVDHTRQIMVVVRVHKQYPCRPTRADVEALAQRFGWSIIRATEAQLRSMTPGLPEYEDAAPVVAEAAAPPPQYAAAAVVIPETPVPPAQTVDPEVAAARPKKQGPGKEVLAQYIVDYSDYAQHKVDEDGHSIDRPASGADAEVG